MTDPLGVVGRIASIPQSALDIGAPLLGATVGAPAGLPGIAFGAGAGSAFAKSLEKARQDTGEPLTVDGLSQSAKEVIGAGAASAAGALLFGGGAQLAGKGIGALFGQRGLLTASKARQARLFQIQQERLVRGFRQQHAHASLQQDATLKAARQQAQSALSALPSETHQRLAALTAEQETIHRSMQQLAERSVLNVRDNFGALAKKTSEEFIALRDTALKGLEQAEVPFPRLVEAIHRRLGGEPESFALALKQLGVSEDLAAVMQKTGGQGIENLGKGFSMTVREVVQRAGKIRRGIAKPARASRESYSFSDKVLDDTSDALLEVLEQSGVKGLEKASSFWAQWAPIRNQAFRDFRPFLQTETETAAGINRLIRVGRGKDPGNAKFIEALEDRLGLSLTDNLRAPAQRLTAIQKERLAVRLNQELRRGEIKRISQQAVDDAKEAYAKTTTQLGQQQQAASSQLQRQQFSQQQALGRKVGVARSAVHVGSVVVLYQLLRRSLDAVLPKFSGGGGD